MAKKPVKEVNLVEAVQAETPEAVQPKKTQDLIRVKNVHGVPLRQFTTGHVIQRGQEADMVDDSWLQSQVKAGYLVQV